MGLAEDTSRRCKETYNGAGEFGELDISKEGKNKGKEELTSGQKFKVHLRTTDTRCQHRHPYQLDVRLQDVQFRLYYY